MEQQKKRGRFERNSTEMLIDNCLTRSLSPYLLDTRVMSGDSLPKNFARATASVVIAYHKKKRLNNMLAERSPEELLAAFNMTKTA